MAGNALLLAGALLSGTASLSTGDGMALTGHRQPVRAREIVISATPLPVRAGQFGRALEVLGTNVITRSRSSSVPEVLETFTFVDVGQRGAGIVQADLSIRGSTFQQVLITLDGVPLLDAQTAHHNMDLPFPPGALERVTVIPGPGSALLGPVAFAGAVDMTPRRPSRTGTRFKAAAGTFDTLRAGLVADHAAESGAMTVAAAHEQSDGFQEGTDYEVASLWAASFTDMDSGKLRLSTGYTDKDFGARDFYAAYPSRELTETLLVDLAPEYRTDRDWLIKAVIRYRRHEDEFILKQDDPSFYRNRHVTDTFTERISLTLPDHSLGRTALGIERSDALLDSSNLDEQDSATSSAFLQHRVASVSCTAHLGLRVDAHSDWDTEISPSMSLAVPLGPAHVWRASVARGIRPPSFTELYYSDPANKGDPELEPEKAWGAETGVDLRLDHATGMTLTYFVRDTDNLIDWVRASEDDPWQAVNSGHAVFQGGEALVVGIAGPCEWETAYRYTDVDSESADMQSKYALNVARHDLRLAVGLPETRGFSASISARYRDVPTLDSYWLAGAGVSQRVGDLVLFARGRNLLDEDYERIPGVPTAGRYTEAGIELVL